MGTVVQSRTYNSLRNSAVALFLYFVNLLLQFFSRKVFIDYIGAELLGLNTTITSILQFLNIAEMGVGTAITCTLYAPLKNNDQKQINDIVSLHGWLYRNIAILILVCSVVLSLLFPYIFDKGNVPIVYVYVTFIPLLFSSLLGYFVNYKQVLLSANQQEYRVQLSYKVVMLLKLLAQIVVIRKVDNGYLWWMALEVLFAIFAALALNFAVRKTFPALKTDTSQGSKLRHKYPEVTTKVSQLFFHKIASFALSQLSPIVIYTYASLVLVAKYSNYMLVVTGLVSMLLAMFNGLNASVGNMVAHNNTDNTLKVFRELFSIRFVIVATFSIVLFKYMTPFVDLWLGADYILPDKTLLLIVIFFYITAMRSVVDSFLQAYGLFKDIWAPIVEACLNIGLSFLLGYFWGLNGVLLGVITSLIVIIFLWKPYFLFTQGLRVPITVYVGLYAKHIVMFLIVCLILRYAMPLFDVSTINSATSFVVKAGGETIIVGAMFVGVAYMLEQGMRDFVRRLLRIVKIGK